MQQSIEDNLSRNEICKQAIIDEVAKRVYEQVVNTDIVPKEEWATNSVEDSIDEFKDSPQQSAILYDQELMQKGFEQELFRL